jgi:hypothetical protein
MITYCSGYGPFNLKIVCYEHFIRGWLRVVTFFILVALWVCPEGESVTDNILSVTFLSNIHLPTHMPLHIYISWDIILPVYMYLLYLLDGTATAWMRLVSS